MTGKPGLAILTAVIIVLLFNLVVIAPIKHADKKVAVSVYNHDKLQEAILRNPVHCGEVNEEFDKQIKRKCYESLSQSSVDEYSCKKIPQNYNTCLQNLTRYEFIELKDSKIEIKDGPGDFIKEDGLIKPYWLFIEGVDTNGNGLYDAIVYKMETEIAKDGHYHFLLLLYADEEVATERAVNVTKGEHFISFVTDGRAQHIIGDNKSYNLILKVYDANTYGTLLWLHDFLSFSTINQAEPYYPYQIETPLSFKNVSARFLVFLLGGLLIFYSINIRSQRVRTTDYFSSKLKWFNKSITFNGMKLIRYDTIFLSALYFISLFFLFLFDMMQWDYFLREQYNTSLASLAFRWILKILTILAPTIMIIRTYITKEKLQTIVAFFLANVLLFLIVAILMVKESGPEWGGLIAIFVLSYYILFGTILIGVFAALCYVDKVFKKIDKLFLSATFYKILGIISLGLFTFLLVKFFSF